MSFEQAGPRNAPTPNAWPGTLLVISARLTPMLHLASSWHQASQPPRNLTPDLPFSTVHSAPAK
jgi:hypothetical protein